MAKWGEGDPRWLVEDRPDGVNVNGWHWEEKNRLDWSKTRIKDLIIGTSSKTICGQGEVTITDVTEVSGEAYLAKRKANKKFAHFDLTIRLKWEGVWALSDKKVTGEVKIHEFSFVNEPDEYEYVVTADGKEEHKAPLQQCAEGMRETLFKLLSQYVSELQEQL